MSDSGDDSGDEPAHAAPARPVDASVDALGDALPALVTELDRDYRIRFANAAYQQWFGLDPAEQIGRRLEHVIGDAAFQALCPALDEALQGESITRCGDVPYAIGGSRFIHGTYLPVTAADGEVVGAHALAVDLSEQQGLRQRLASETQRARTIVDNAIDGIVTIDADGVMLSFNPAAERIFGYSASEAIGASVGLIMPEPDRSHHDEYINRYLRTDEPHVIGIGREVTGQHRDGTLVDIELAVAEFKADGQRYFTGFVRDVSDRKRAERQAQRRLEELARITRLHSMGELATGLAHEVNQPLTAVHANAQACLTMLDAEPTDTTTLRGALQDIAWQSGRASEVIERLRSFLRTRHVEDRTAENPNTLIEEVLSLMAGEIRAASVRVERNLMPDPSRISVNRVQIEQVIFNLIKNAVEAMAEHAGERVLQVSTAEAPGNRPESLIAIRDTGAGISQAHLEHLFDPFFTTKSSGMGQGLAIARSIAEGHYGDLQGRNRDAGGMVFELRLPVADRSGSGS